MSDYQEARRVTMARAIQSIAQQSKTNDEFVERVSREFGTRYINCGASRSVYELPADLVLKVENRQHMGQTQAEIELSKERPELFPKMYTGYVYKRDGVIDYGDGVSMIVQEKAESLPMMWELTPELTKQFLELDNILEDFGPRNAGLVNGRVVAVDGGCGLRFQ